MILGFLGKGGSGKSSVSSQMALSLCSTNTILAIDADHNMDLSFNLTDGNVPKIAYFSQSLPSLQESLGVPSDEKYSEVFLSDIPKRFHLSPLSNEIEKYSVQLPNTIRLMTAGPQTDTVLYGKACSHILTTPLKVLLPLLELRESEVVVVDEKAGADGVSTGIVTGIDVGIIVCEPALHSIKTARQIAELMDFYETPYLFVGNKMTSNEDVDFMLSQLPKPPIAYLVENSEIKRNPSQLVREWADELSTIYHSAQKLNQNNRLERTIRKFKRNQDFNPS